MPEAEERGERRKQTHFKPEIEELFKCCLHGYYLSFLDQTLNQQREIHQELQLLFLL
jgi:hypothetical protein